MVSSGNSNKFKLKSKYFNFHGTPREQDLVNSLIKETIHKNGINMLYIPRQYVNLDKIYGEDVLSSFSKTYEMVFYVESSDSYAGNGSFFGNMGFDIQDQATLILSRDVFKEVIVDSPDNSEGLFTVDGGPRRGDLLYWPQTGRIFEIVDMKNFKMFYQLGKLYTYEIVVEFWDYAHEKVETNLPEIDNKFNSVTTKKFEIKIDSPSIIPYTVGEQVYTGDVLVTSEFIGEVESYNPDTQIVTVISSYGQPVDGQTLTGDDSGASAEIVSDIPKKSIDERNDNVPLETQGNASIIKDPEDDY